MDKADIARSTVWDMVKKEKSSQPRKLSPRVTVWIESEIDEFIEKIVAS